MPLLIANEADYQSTLTEAMLLGQENEEQQHLRLLELGEAIDTYEIAQGHEPALPSTLAGWLEVEMFHLRMRQK